MNLTSKQRAKLRALANGIDTLFQIGKGGVSESLVDQTTRALKKRELIKLRTLETAPDTVHDTAVELARKTRSVVVQVIGSKLILYKKNEKNPQIIL